MTAPSRSFRAAILRGLLMVSAAAIVPACKHHGDDGDIPGFLGFSAATFNADESDGSAVITVTRTGGALGAVTVQYFTSDGTAQAGSDYLSSSGTLSWAAGDATPKTFSVPIMNDASVEGVEAVQLTLAAPTGGAVLQTSSALLLIADDDAATSVFQFNAASYEAGEGAGTATITVVRTGVTTGAGSVGYATSDGTATSGADYTAASGTLNFGAGETLKTFTVPILQDSSPEADETVNLTLSGPSGGVLGTMSTAVLTIRDDDALAAGKLQLSASAYAVSESGGMLTVTVERVGGSSGAVTVDYATSNGTAAAGSDYTAASGTLSFAAGEISKTFDVPILEDALAEGSETFSVSLSNPGGGAILGSPASAVVTLTDNDVPTLSIADNSVAEGSSGTANLVFTVTLSLPSAQTVEVDYQTAAGTAAEGTDYAAASGTLTIPAGQTSGQIMVQVNGDTQDEEDETLTLNLSNPVNATILDGTATGTIQNDDDPTISIDDVAVAEGNSGTKNFTFTVTLSGQSLQDVSVHWETQDDTATAGQDYAAASGTLVIPAGQTSGQISVVVNGDTTGELDETFFVNLSGPVNATIADAQGVGTITNDDLPAITIRDVTVAEGNSGTVNAVFRVDLSSTPLLPVSVNYATAAGTASAGTDYATTSGTLAIPAGQTFGQITVQVNGDTTDETDETFLVNLSSPVNAVIVDAQGVGTIDDDDGPTISIDSVQVTEGNGGTTDAVFTVTLSAASPQPVSVEWVTENGTAIAPQDYMAASNTLTIPAGQTSGQFTVQVNGDTTDETDETFLVNLSNAVDGTITAGQGVGTIDDDDGPTISIADVAATEGDADTKDFTFTVNLSAASPQPVSVNWATADGTATTVDSDYAAAAGTLTIPAGQTFGQITVQVNGDTTDENDETFTVNLSNPVDGTISDGTATGTIQNDDDPTIAIGDVTQPEGNANGTFSFTVTLSHASLQPVQVTYSTADGTAVAGSDYVAVTSGTVTIPEGSLTHSIPITVIGDGVDEAAEVFYVDIASATNTSSITKSQGVGTIQNDDDPTVSIADAQASEGAGSIAFTVTLSHASLEPVQVNFSTADGSATSPADYGGGSGYITIISGNLSGQILIDLVDDVEDETDETFTVNLTGASNATISDGSATGTILDNDGPTISIGDVTFTEGDSGTKTFTFTVSLSSESPQDVSVSYSTVNGKALAGEDYVAKSGVLTIHWGDNTGTIQITVNGDTQSEPDEEFEVVLSNPVNATILDGTGVGTILTDDPPALNIDDVIQAEGNSGQTTFTFRVWITNPIGTDVTFDYATADGSATAGSDYSSASGTGLIAAGMTETTITVQVIGDLDPEGDEVFFVGLSNISSNAVAGDIQAQGTILEDDGPAITIDDATTTEGDSDTKKLSFTVHLSFAWGEDVVIDFGTADGTASTLDGDYWGASDQVTIPAGQTTGTIEIDIIGDLKNESHEDFYVNLTGTSAGVIQDSRAVGTITNDDPAPNISINDVSLPEGDAGPTEFNFTVSLSNPADRDIHVNYATQPNTATEEVDYQGASGTVTIDAGATTAVITVVVFGDTQKEGDETFYVNLTGTDYGNITDPQGVGTIQDDEAPTVTQANPSNEATEVPLNTHLVLDFSEAMDTATVDNTTVTISPSLTNPLIFYWNGTNDRVTIVFDTTAPVGIEGDDVLQEGQPYTVTLSTGVRSAGGRPLAAPYITSFTTRTDATPPQISSILSVGVPGNQDPRTAALTGSVTGFVVTFNEDMDRTRGRAELENGDEAWDDINSTGQNMTVSWVNSTTFSIVLSGPFSPLPQKKIFRLRLDEMVDTRGNYMISDDITVVTAPTSDGTPPTVTGTIPMNGQTGVPRDAAVLIGFSEPMHPDVVSKVQVTSGAGDTLYDVVYGDAPGVMVVPRKAWPAGATIQVSIPGGSPAGVRDAFGNFKAATQTISFTVVGVDSTVPTFWEHRSAFKDNATDVNAWNWGNYLAFKKGNRPAFLNQQIDLMNGFSLVEAATGIPFKGYRAEVDHDGGTVRLQTGLGMYGLQPGTQYQLGLDADLQDSEGVSFGATVLMFTTVTTVGGQTRPNVWGPPELELQTGNRGAGVQRYLSAWTNMYNDGTQDILEVECSDITQQGFSASSDSGGATNWFDFEYESDDLGEPTITTTGTHIFQFDYRDYSSLPGTPLHEFSIQQWSHVFADSSLPWIMATDSATPIYNWGNLPVSGPDECIGAAIVVIDASTGEDLCWFIVNRTAGGTFTHPADMALPSGQYMAAIAAVKMESGTVRGIACMGIGAFLFTVP